jgi:secretion/DNA translocation related CpaE-like protein
MNNPLILTRDETLLDELLRLAAAAGVVPEVATDPGGCLAGWSQASTVLVGVDQLEAVARARPPRRAGLHVVAWGSVPDSVFRMAIDVGAQDVAELPQSDSWVLELFADAVDGVSGESLTLGVIGGAGGSGATTLACALGLSAATRGPACLIDADPLGAGVDRVLGFDRVDGLRWEALEQTTGRLSARALRESLPRRQGLGVLTWAHGRAPTLQPFAVREAMAAGARGHHTVVVDLARSGGALTEELASRCDHLVMTVPATVCGLGAAARLAARVGHPGRLWLVLRGAGVDPAVAARSVGAPVLLSMADQRGLDEAVNLGAGPVRSRRAVLARTADRILDQLSSAAAGQAA